MQIFMHINICKACYVYLHRLMYSDITAYVHMHTNSKYKETCKYTYMYIYIHLCICIYVHM